MEDARRRQPRAISDLPAHLRDASSGALRVLAGDFGRDVSERIRALSDD